MEQLAIVTNAILIFGMHGGAMWNVAKVLVEDQHVVEIIPSDRGATTCVLSKMTGLKTYRSIPCAACNPHGAVDAELVANTVADVLSGKLAESSPCGCFFFC